MDKNALIRTLSLARSTYSDKKCYLYILYSIKGKESALCEMKMGLKPHDLRRSGKLMKEILVNGVMEWNEE